MHGQEDVVVESDCCGSESTQHCDERFLSEIAAIAPYCTDCGRAFVVTDSDFKQQVVCSCPVCSKKIVFFRIASHTFEYDSSKDGVVFHGFWSY